MAYLQRNEYTLPITIDNADVVYKIPQGSELINQTSMTVNSDGEPVIAAYWKPGGNSSPQYHIVWQDGNEWRSRQITHRNSPFSLSGGGTKRIPISRPQIVAGDNQRLYVIYRDFERDEGVSLATSIDPDYRDWDIADIYPESVEIWEPTYDTHAWNEYVELHLFVQKVGQGDGETLEELEPQAVSILEWRP